MREAEELAEVTGRSLTRSALVLAAWERAGCRPGPGDIAALDVLGVGDSYEPTSGAVESLRATVLSTSSSLKKRCRSVIGSPPGPGSSRAIISVR